jgi:Ca2+-binding EF-hand superfamily protein
MVSKKEAAIEDFRTILRVAAAEGGVSVLVFLRKLFEHSLVKGADGEYLSRAAFESGLTSLREVRGKLTRASLNEVFDECDDGGRGKVTLDEISTLCQKTISDARALALKVRNVLIQEYQDERGFRGAFDSIERAGKFVDKYNFKLFLADHLSEEQVSDSDSAGVYAIFDADSDGKVGIDDFLCFVMAEQTVRAARVLAPGGSEVVVDVQVSNTAAQDTALRAAGYEHVTSLDVQGRPRQTSEGTFGRGGNLWIWRRSQGTAAGRLKPIMDVQLEAKSTSSAMVMAGYTCLPGVTVGGQYMWIRRMSATDHPDDAIVDLAVTTGKSKVATDAMHDPPTAGQWLRADGNFGNKGFMGGFCAFLWMRNSKPRGMDVAPISPLSAALVLSTEQRAMRLSLAVRTVLRNFIPVSEIKRATDHYQGDGQQIALNGEDNTETPRVYDFASLYHTYGAYNTLNMSSFTKLLTEVGAALDSADVSKVFYFFDANVDGSITREEFNHVVAYTEHELDVTCEAAKLRAVGKQEVHGALSKVTGSPASPGGHSLRVTRVLSELFHMCNINGDGIISMPELQYFFIRMELYLTEEETRVVMKMMDVGGDDRVEEVLLSDFDPNLLLRAQF